MFRLSPAYLADEWRRKCLLNSVRILLLALDHVSPIEEVRHGYGSRLVRTLLKSVAILPCRKSKACIRYGDVCRFKTFIATDVLGPRSRPLVLPPKETNTCAGSDTW